jgi:hypothetical protein
MPELPDPRADGVLVGRSDDVVQLVRNLVLGRHTLLVGESGVGKSRLMAESRRVLLGMTKRIECAEGILARRGGLGLRVKTGQYRMLALDHPAPVHRCVGEMLQRMYEHGDLALDGAPGSWEAARAELARLSRSELQSLAVEGIARAPVPYLLFLDNLDRVPPSLREFLEELLKVAVVCAACVEVRETAGTRQFWASFARMPVRPLDGSEAAALVDHLLDTYAFRAEDMEMYRRELLEAGGGSPAAIRTMAWHSSREPIVSREEIRALRRSDRSRYFNMGPIYIFGFALFTLLKIFSIGMENTEFYIYFSALGFIAYLVFRVFRPFFVFRPQRDPPA